MTWKSFFVNVEARRVSVEFIIVRCEVPDAEWCVRSII